MTTTHADAQTAKFETLLAAENEVRIMQTIIAFRDSNVSDYQADRQVGSLEASKARLAAAWDALSLDELRAYGEWRK